MEKNPNSQVYIHFEGYKWPIKEENLLLLGTFDNKM